jgi:Uncharacterized conserved protein
MSYLPSSPNLASLTGLMAKFPRCGVLLFKLLENNRSSFSPLSGDVHDLISAYVSDLNQSASCFNTHKVLTKEMGMDESIFRQLKLDIDSAQVDEKLKPLLRFVKKLTLTPSQITQAEIKNIYAAGWDERALLDTVRLCALVNCMNRFALGAGIDKPALNQRPPLSHPRMLYHS